MGKTKINWADDTWNPVRGCTRVSEGCRNCYAEAMAARIVAMDKGRGRPSKYYGLVRVVDGDARWTGAVTFDPVVLAAPLKCRKPTIYFVNSMSDLFHDGFTFEQIAAVFGVMAATPQHTFIVLTKRAQRMREWFEQGAASGYAPGHVLTRGLSHLHIFDDDRLCDVINVVNGVSQWRDGHPGGWPLPNVILGVSVENQATADERIPHLLATPAAVRAISAEPLLGPLDIKRWMRWVFRRGIKPNIDGTPFQLPAEGGGPGLDWVIAGCESGPNARPCEVAWLRSLRDQCVAAEVPFWLKQARADELGHGCVIENGRMLPLPLTTGPGSERKPGGIIDLPYLDGVQWAQRPVRR